MALRGRPLAVAVRAPGAWLVVAKVVAVLIFAAVSVSAQQGAVDSSALSQPMPGSPCIPFTLPNDRKWPGQITRFGKISQSYPS